jgi:hypothetical protein
MKRILTVALLLVGAVALTATGAAVLTDNTVTLDKPDNQVIEVDANFSGPATATVELQRDGTTVKSTSYTGASGESHTLSIDPTGLQNGDYSLNITADDEANVTVADTRLLTTIEPVSVEENGTLYTDVELSSTSAATATVTLTDADNATQLNQTTLNFDPIDYEDGTGIVTDDWVADGTYQNVSVQIETSPANTYSASWVDTEPASGVFIGGMFDSSQETKIALAIAAFAIAAWILWEDYLE